jgi:hypothetical protein
MRNRGPAHPPLVQRLGRRSFLGSLGRASAGVAAALGANAVGLGVALAGCSSGSGDQTSSDESARRPARTGREPPDFAPMFQPGVRYELDGNNRSELVVEVDEAGVVYLATGRLVGCDPFWAFPGDDANAPYTVTVPPGRYPVDVSFARQTRPDPRSTLGTRLGAAARLRILDEPAETWEMAVRPDEDPADLPPGAFYGIPVDTGTAAFVDATALAPLRQYLDRLDQQEMEVIESDPISLASLNGEAHNIVLDDATGLNVVVFGCGMGDGNYPVWVGRNRSGDPTCFIADLEILSHHATGPIED